ncbi:MAG: ATP-binding protein [Leptonema sp. (in: Bacteria)]|nr:ATP-binding protein [Leptonema sp. (in: bacteria)]
MPNQSPRVLLIHHSLEWLKSTRALLRERGFYAVATRKLSIALELQSRYRPEIIITTIKFTRSKGQEVIDALHRQERKASILVIYNETTAEQMQELVAGSYFNSFSLPIEPEILISHVNQAWLHYKEKNSLFQYLEEYQDRLHDQLDWLAWKTHNKHEFKVKYSQALMANIRNTILQGMGLGSLITRMDLLQLKMKKDGDSYIVPQKDIDNIILSTQNVHKWLGNMEKINQALERHYELTEISSEQFSEEIINSVHAIEKFRAIKNHKINIADLKLDSPIIGNTDAIGLCIRELAINAFKFSPEASSIDIVKFESPLIVLIGVLNDILPMGGGITGVPDVYASQLYEPFYKLNNIYDERFFDEDFSMGIGLTIVQGIIQQMGGQIFISEITDHSSKVSQLRRVMVQLIFKKNSEQSKNKAKAS